MLILCKRKRVHAPSNNSRLHADVFIFTLHLNFNLIVVFLKFSLSQKGLSFVVVCEQQLSKQQDLQPRWPNNNDTSRRC